MNGLKALVLNSAYEPLQFTTARRAFVLVLLGKAEMIEVDGFFIRSADQSFRLPTVIRLNRYVRRPAAGLTFSKKNVLRRDRHTCQYCGAPGKELTLDHVLPRSMGGLTRWENVVAACRRCNLIKGARTPQQAGMLLARPPHKPSFLIRSCLPENAPPSHRESWLRYLPSVKRQGGG
jgi:5-methylcytosine-specific restriction endonuclease McrA